MLYPNYNYSLGYELAKTLFKNGSSEMEAGGLDVFSIKNPTSVLTSQKRPYRTVTSPNHIVEIQWLQNGDIYMLNAEEGTDTIMEENSLFLDEDNTNYYRGLGRGGLYKKIGHSLENQLYFHQGHEQRTTNNPSTFGSPSCVKFLSVKFKPIYGIFN